MVIHRDGQIVRAGEGRTFRFPAGNHGEVKAASDTKLAFGFMKTHLPRGTGMPLLHVHRSLDEAFQILDGVVEYRLGDGYVTAHAGDAVLVPSGVPHCFRAISADGATLILLVSPADGIDVIEQLATGDLRDMAWTASVLARYHTELLEAGPHWPPT